MDYKDQTLEFLGIQNVFLRIKGGVTCLVKVLNVSEFFWEIYTSTELKEELCILSIDFKNGENLEVVVYVEKDSERHNNYFCNLDDILPQPLIRKINELRSLSEISNKRTEERFEIGLENWEVFNLNRPDVFFIFQNHPVKTIISNASYHGALLLGERSFVQNGMSVEFCCSFKDGVVKQKAVIINAEQMTAAYFKYSIMFIEPISLLWKKQIMNFAKCTADNC